MIPQNNCVVCFGYSPFTILLHKAETLDYMYTWGFTVTTRHLRHPSNFWLDRAV